MGYYSRYSLEVKGEHKDAFDVDFEADKVQCEYGDLSTVLDYDGYSFSDSCKWYGWREDMNKISLDYPNTLFVVKREGEESGDIEKGYFRNGNAEYVQAQLVFDEPSESLLSSAASDERLALMAKRSALEARARELQEALREVEQEKEKL